MTCKPNLASVVVAHTSNIIPPLEKKKQDNKEFRASLSNLPSEFKIMLGYIRSCLKISEEKKFY